MGRVYWQRVFILFFLSNEGICQRCKQIRSILGLEALFLAYTMCRELLCSWRPYSARHQHCFLLHFISKECTALLQESYRYPSQPQNFPEHLSKRLHRAKSSLQTPNEWLLNVYHFDVTFMRALISFWL